MALSKNDTQHYSTTIMISVFMLSVFILSVANYPFMLNAIMLSVVMLSVAAPQWMLWQNKLERMAMTSR